MVLFPPGTGVPNCRKDIFGDKQISVAHGQALCQPQPVSQPAVDRDCQCGVGVERRGSGRDDEVFPRVRRGVGIRIHPRRLRPPERVLGFIPSVDRSGAFASLEARTGSSSFSIEVSYPSIPLGIRAC